MKKLNIGMIGYGFMGRAHSNAYRRVSNFFVHSPPSDYPPSFFTNESTSPNASAQLFCSSAHSRRAVKTRRPPLLCAQRLRQTLRT